MLMVTYLQRDRIIDLTCMGSFFLSHMLLVMLGLLATPWQLETYLPLNFPYLSWELVTERHLTGALIVVSAGMAMVLLGHVLGDVLAYGLAAKRRAQWADMLRRRHDESDVPYRSPTTLYFLLLIVATGFLSTRIGPVLDGLFIGYLGGDVAAQYAARAAMQDLGRPFYYIVFNALPFLSLISWASARTLPSVRARRLSWALALSTAALLFATFEKRPLIVFLVGLLLTHIGSEVHAQRLTLRLPSHFPVSPRFWIEELPWRWLVPGLAVASGILVGLYALSTEVIAQFGVTVESWTTILNITISHVFGRLAVMPILYFGYFPRVHDFYGLTNIGALMGLLGKPTYDDTVAVLQYYSGATWGSGAIGCLFDFYAAFGPVGLVFLAVALGVLLNFTDRWLTRQGTGPLALAMRVSMLTTASYLAQASLPRTMATYGGAIFLVLWFVMKRQPQRVAVRGD